VSTSSLQGCLSASDLPNDASSSEVLGSSSTRVPAGSLAAAGDALPGWESRGQVGSFPALPGAFCEAGDWGILITKEEIDVLAV